jgi:hypothetical protein
VNEAPAPAGASFCFSLYTALMGGIGSGGARSHSGTAPNPYALKRQRDGKEWTKLPATGRLELPPEWPDEVSEPSEKELLMWRRIWMLPQALVWEADRVHDMVAFYVRTYLEAMRPGAGAQARTFVKQMSEALLLTPSTLAQQRYVIEGTPEAQAIDAAVASGGTGRRAAPKKSAKERTGFTVVPDTGPAEDEPDEPDVADDDNAPPF